MSLNWSLFLVFFYGVLATSCFCFPLFDTTRGSDVFTCKKSPQTVTAGEAVSVTFNFPYDVSRNRVEVVTVERFPLNGSDPTYPEMVVVCPTLDASIHSCKTTSEGYSLEGEVKTSLTLRIKDVSPKHSGRFFCRVMIPEREPLQSEPCSLLVRDVLDVSATTTTEPAKPAVTTDLGGQDVLDVSATTTTEPVKPVTTDLGGQGSDRNNEKTTPSWMIPVIVTSVILLIIVAIIFATILLCKRRKCRMDKSLLSWRSLLAKKPSKVGTPPTAVTAFTAVPLLMADLPRSRDNEDESRRADEKNDEDDQGEEKTDGGRGDGEGGAGKDDNDKDAGEENEDKEPFLDAVIIG